MGKLSFAAGMDWFRFDDGDVVMDQEPVDEPGTLIFSSDQSIADYCEANYLDKFKVDESGSVSAWSEYLDKWMTIGRRTEA